MATPVFARLKSVNPRSTNTRGCIATALGTRLESIGGGDRRRPVKKTSKRPPPRADLWLVKRGLTLSKAGKDSSVATARAL